jgi:hypothetical protein
VQCLNQQSRDECPDWQSAIVNGYCPALLRAGAGSVPLLAIALLIAAIVESAR